MIYRYRMKFDGDSFKVYLLLAACVVVGIGAFFVLSTLWAIVLFLVCVVMAFQILKMMAKTLRARIITYTDGFTVYMTDGTKQQFEWDLISYAGFVVEGIQKGYVFVYEESVDRFIQLPPTFENLAGFREEIEEHHPVEDCIMKPSETIKERIKSIFVPESGDDSEADAEKTAEVEDQTESGTTDESEEAEDTK
ncbi:MAG: hypothetical protein J5647_12960 [Spirochaetaceae bacterium]|nr:hypothetical protein [Spirochaetaceae bacterium]